MHIPGSAKLPPSFTGSPKSPSAKLPPSFPTGSPKVTPPSFPTGSPKAVPSFPTTGSPAKTPPHGNTPSHLPKFGGNHAPQFQLPMGGSPALKKKAAPPPPVVSAAAIMQATVLYPYEPQHEGDLELKEGQVIKVTKNEGGWWEGSANGQTGIFPANYVKML